MPFWKVFVAKGKDDSMNFGAILAFSIISSRISRLQTCSSASKGTGIFLSVVPLLIHLTESERLEPEAVNDGH